MELLTIYITAGSKKSEATKLVSNQHKLVMGVRKKAVVTIYAAKKKQLAVSVLTAYFYKRT